MGDGNGLNFFQFALGEILGINDAGYDDLPQLADQIVEAAIDAEMAHLGYEGSVKEGFRSSFNFHAVGDPDAPAPGPEEQQDLFELQQRKAEEDYQRIVHKWQTQISELLTPWSELPDEGQFESARATAAAAVVGLSDGSFGDDADSGQSDAANDELVARLGEAEGLLDAFDGKTILAFLEYLRLLRLRLHAQAKVAASLAIAVEAEAALWTAARSDTADFAKDAFWAMTGSHPHKQSDNDGARNALALIGVVAGVIGAPLSGGASIALAAVAGGAGLLAGFIPEDPPPPVYRELEGAHPDDVFANMKRALEDQNDSIVAEEKSLGTALSGVDDKVHGDLDTYRIADVDLLDSASIRDYDDKLRTLKVDGNKLFIAGDTSMPGVAGELEATVTTLQSVLIASACQRPGGIGYGGGPTSEWYDLQRTLTWILTGTAAQVRDAGDHLIKASKIIDHTDVEVDRSLRRHVKKVDDTALPFDTVPPPPSPPNKYGRGPQI